MVLFKRKHAVNFGLGTLLIAAVVLIFQSTAQEQSRSIPNTTQDVVSALNSSKWASLESGIDVIRAITQTGIVMTAYRISPGQFEFSIVTQFDETGSRAKDVGEREGAVLTTNAGFFAERINGELYPIGFLRLDNKTLSKGWDNEGGIVTWENNTLKLMPTHEGIPSDNKHALQSRPMLIEPQGKWAMASNLSENKNRTVLCIMENGDVILAVVTRVGMSLFEAGWIMRDPSVGGFFNCDAAMALDGGRSTQVWYSDDPKFSYPGLVPVHNFMVVRAREN